LLKDYKPPSAEEKKAAEEAEEAAAEEMPEETDDGSTLSLETPVELTEFTPDLMNPEGAPTFEDSATEQPPVE
jgi:hypothetical protein